MAIDDQPQCAEGRPHHAEGSAEDTGHSLFKVHMESRLQGSGRLPPEPGGNDVKEKNVNSTRGSADHGKDPKRQL